MVAIICMKLGKAFTAHQVNTLYESLVDTMAEPFTFVCLTDDERGLAKPILAVSIPDLELPKEAWRRGCWPKFTVLAPHLFPRDDVVMFVGLHVVARRPLAPFFSALRAPRHIAFHEEPDAIFWRCIPKLLKADRCRRSSLLPLCLSSAEPFYERVSANAEPWSSPFKINETHRTEIVTDRRNWPIGFRVNVKRSSARRLPFNFLFLRARWRDQENMLVLYGDTRPLETLVEAGELRGTKPQFRNGPIAWIIKCLSQTNVIPKARGASGLLTRQSGADRRNRTFSGSPAVIYLPGPAAKHPARDPAG